MKPLEHAQKDVDAFGGRVEDYLPIHDFFDQTKAFIPDMRHRAVLHNAWGIFLCERVFGPSITNADGKVLATRTIAERHVLQDLKFIPTFEQCFGSLPMYDWLTGKSESFRAVLVDALTKMTDGGGDDDDHNNDDHNNDDHNDDHNDDDNKK